MCPTEYAKRQLLEVVVKGEVNERFVGVGLEKGKWVARVYGKQGRGLPRQNDIRVGTFLTKEDAVLARDRYIIDNGLEWARDKLNVLSWEQEASPCR